MNQIRYPDQDIDESITQKKKNFEKTAASGVKLYARIIIVGTIGIAIEMKNINPTRALGLIPKNFHPVAVAKLFHITKHKWAWVLMKQ